METDYRKILLDLAYSLTLADHLGDALEAIDYALRLAGVPLPAWEDEGDNWRQAIKKAGGKSLWEDAQPPAAPSGGAAERGA